MKISHSNISNRQTFREIAALHITSPEFEGNGFIPSRFTCDGANVSPPLDVHDIPNTAKSLALIVDDPDAPIRAWVHWLAWNIPVAQHIKEDTEFKDQGVNDFRQNKYGGPCPPYGVHRYHFKVYALDVLLELPADTSKTELEKAITGHVVAYGELVGKYKRK
ncbi:YbhB/YbcL family Raf kinase inhibitor-like protein [Niastella caeni]|uniref:YbhB/YbcL family Raf kinase inhibitor-like protein n=1 Tax=Niastella caeni TaxID=2569763 RepID=A0A4S8HNN4_9BACT|nr:YbhB/YbcL family Raf kinase inhibitor-like protein [Niastella caeni]THU36079.1 YbhB/YbcL family Raf kinase inhibitor-like protein [Niastella caeni]